MLVIESLAEHAEDHRHTAHANDCGHGRGVDFAPWIKRLGAAYPMARLRKRLVCSACGSKSARPVGSYCWRPV